ncbi:MAG: metal ABC transporter permease [Candidatus Bipolaricaulia bacterium]
MIFSEMFAFGFMQRALIVGILIGLLASFLSLFIILKRMSFIGTGLAHSAFGGVAIGVLTGLNPVLTAGAFALAVAAGIGIIARKGRLSEDVAIGILFSASMALGIALIGLSTVYNVNLFGYLFGSLLAVTWTDIWIVTGVGLTIAVLLVLFFNRFLFISFDEEIAQASGLSVTTLYYLLLMLIAVTIVISFKVVGILLISALLVIPGATGYRLAKNYRGVLAISLLVGIISVIGGLSVSFVYDIAPGAAIILCATVLFGLSFLIRRVRVRRRTR